MALIHLIVEKPILPVFSQYCPPVFAGYRLNGAKVMGSDQYMMPHDWPSSLGAPTYCGDPVSGEGYAGGRVEVVCDPYISAQYIAVYKHADGFLTICEVLVIKGK